MEPEDVSDLEEHSEELYGIINHESDRITRLNKQISEAMSTSKELL